MAVSLNRAVLYPKEKGACNPISINWDGDKVSKAIKFFTKVCKEAKKEKPPRVFKQIAFFYRNNELAYIKPFNIIK